MYEIKIDLKTVMDALEFITEKLPENNCHFFVLRKNPLIEISNGKIITENDEFVIENAEMRKGGMKVKLSVNKTIKAFTRKISKGKVLLLKGTYGSPFIEIEIIEEQLALIRF
ncbi:MAG: hypothetical protein KAI71_00790 [Candidatus Pacebacteria bacterium]|nr:hypothetical protein [Candidatus Paceibacterota bacterium]